MREEGVSQGLAHHRQLANKRMSGDLLPVRLKKRSLLRWTASVGVNTSLSCGSMPAAAGSRRNCLTLDGNPDAKRCHSSE